MSLDAALQNLKRFLQMDLFSESRRTGLCGRFSSEEATFSQEECKIDSTGRKLDRGLSERLAR